MVNGVKKAEVYWELSQLKKIKDIKEAVKQFEVYLVRQFLKEAEKSLPGGLFSPKGSFSSGLYYDLFYMELSQRIGEELGKNVEPLFERALRAYRGEGS